jgi:hypothetical protein
MAFPWFDDKVARLMGEIRTQNLTNRSRSADHYTMILGVKSGKYEAFICPYCNEQCQLNDAIRREKGQQTKRDAGVRNDISFADAN